MWCLIYDNKKVIELFFNSGSKIATKSTIYQSPSREECFNKIDELGYVFDYPSGDTKTIIFSGGSRSIIDNEEI